MRAQSDAMRGAIPAHHPSRANTLPRAQSPADALTLPLLQAYVAVLPPQSGACLSGSWAPAGAPPPPNVPKRVPTAAPTKRTAAPTAPAPAVSGALIGALVAIGIVAVLIPPPPPCALQPQIACAHTQAHARAHARLHTARAPVDEWCPTALLDAQATACSTRHVAEPPPYGHSPRERQPMSAPRRWRRLCCGCRCVLQPAP